MGIINPRIVVMEKMIISEFTNTIGKENIYLSVEDGVERCREMRSGSKTIDESAEEAQQQ